MCRRPSSTGSGPRAVFVAYLISIHGDPGRRSRKIRCNTFPIWRSIARAAYQAAKMVIRTRQGIVSSVAAASLALLSTSPSLVAGAPVVVTDYKQLVGTIGVADDYGTGERFSRYEKQSCRRGDRWCIRSRGKPPLLSAVRLLRSRSTAQISDRQ